MAVAKSIEDLVIQDPAFEMVSKEAQQRYIDAVLKGIIGILFSFLKDIIV